MLKRMKGSLGQHNTHFALSAAGPYVVVDVKQDSLLLQDGNGHRKWQNKANCLPLRPPAGWLGVVLCVVALHPCTLCALCYCTCVYTLCVVAVCYFVAPCVLYLLHLMCCCAPYVLYCRTFCAQYTLCALFSCGYLMYYHWGPAVPPSFMYLYLYTAPFMLCTISSPYVYEHVDGTLCIRLGVTTPFVCHSWLSFCTWRIFLICRTHNPILSFELLPPVRGHTV